MTLIIKELIIRGIVTNDHTPLENDALDTNDLSKRLQEMKKEIEQKCLEKIKEDLDNLKTR